MQVFSRELRAEKFRLGLEFEFRICPGLEPDFIHTLLLPVGEQADTVGARFNCIEMLLQLIERKIFINVLPHSKGRLEVERNFRDYAKSAERDNGTAKGVTVFITRELQHVA